MRRRPARRARAPESPETRRKKSEAAKAAAAERGARKRWYVTLSIKRHPMRADRWGCAQYVKLAWPMLFKTEQAAWDHARAWFSRHPWEMPDGRRIVSYALSTTYLPKP